MPISLSEIFSEFSPSEISKGYSIPYPVKVGTAPEKPYPFIIKEGLKTAKGTKISQYALKQFQSGKWTPSKTTVNKLRNFYHRVNYHRLRSSGASTGQARTHYKSINVKDKISQFRRSVLAIAKGKEVDPLHVAYMMTRADPRIKDLEYWKQYTKTRGYTPPDDEEIDDYEWDEYLDEDYTEED